MVYVDDFKLSGPVENLAKGWELLRKDLHLGNAGPAGQFLGCNHREYQAPSPWTGKTVRCVEWDMEDFLKKCVEDYKELAGVSTLRKVSTPFLEDTDPDQPGTVGPRNPGGKNLPESFRVSLPEC